MTEYIVLLIVFLLLSAFFSSSETAFFSIDAMRVETFLREGRTGAERVSALLSQPTRLLSAILLGNNLTNTAAAAVGTVIATQLVPGGPGLVAATFVVTALLVVFGEIGPKTVALEHNWVVARLYAPPLALWARLARPVVAVLDRVSRAMLALGGERTGSPQSLTPGELRTAIHLGAEKGTVEEQASGVMLGALDLAERQIQTIMTHRSKVVAVEAAESVGAASRRLMEEGYLRMPVYDAEPDNVVGFLHISEISAVAAAPHLDQPVRELMRRPLFEPTSASIGPAGRHTARSPSVSVGHPFACGGADRRPGDLPGPRDSRGLPASIREVRLGRRRGPPCLRPQGRRLRRLPGQR